MGQSESKGQAGGSSSNSPPDGITQISDSVYLLTEPLGTPEIEIVFIHGLQLSDYKQAYWKTWVTEEKGNDGKEVIWPMTWLKELMPQARILSLSYDSSARMTDKTGRMDGYLLGETLAQEMVEMANVGQHDCPVVFVCHSLGGIVVKEIVIKAQQNYGTQPTYVKFLQNIRGFHFYATPHDGSRLADLASYLPNTGRMVEKLKLINDNLGRLNANFERIERDHYANRWQFSVVAEKNLTKYLGFSRKVVEETSARHVYKKFMTVATDHFGVCKPKSKSSTNYLALTKFISEDIMASLKLPLQLTTVQPSIV